MSAKYIAVFGVVALLISIFFQNCSPANFAGSRDYSSLTVSGASVANYSTSEDTLLSADLARDKHTLGGLMGSPSAYAVVVQTAQGTLTFSDADAKFTYLPRENFFGDDSFQFSEIQSGSTNAIIRTVTLRVLPANDLPIIKTDYLSFEMNSKDNAIVLEMADVDDSDLRAALNASGTLLTLNTPNGLIEQRGTQLFYTPARAFRGAEQVEFFALDLHGGFGRKIVTINVGNPFRDLSPALAIRGTGCVTCHANVRSQFVTDFGNGSDYFAGRNGGALTFGSGHIYGDHHNSWRTANIVGPIIVPKTASELPLSNVNVDLATYLRAQEATKTAPAAVVEKNTVYIGAPTIAQLESRFNISSSVTMKYVVNDATSPALNGLSLSGAGYYTNTGEVTCDGDLFLRGTVYLNEPVIRTKNGCRIHATGPIFLQKGPSYVNLGSPEAANNTNLQLVSASVIVMGVGLSHCETDDTMWFFKNKRTNPLYERLLGIWTVKSHVTRLSPLDPTAEGTAILAEAGKLTGYQDASCYTGGRSVHLERILLNAPMVQSRLTGNVSGVVITEVALFALSKFSYSFDAVFKAVPVLPLLLPSDFLVVQ